MLGCASKILRSLRTQLATLRELVGAVLPHRATAVITAAVLFFHLNFSNLGKLVHIVLVLKIVQNGCATVYRPPLDWKQKLALDDANNDTPQSFHGRSVPLSVQLQSTATTGAIIPSP
jgi:hypothetical protein